MFYKFDRIVTGDFMEQFFSFLLKNPIILIYLFTILVVIMVWAVKNYQLIYTVYKKYEEIILYLIVGGLTTVVSLGSYAVLVWMLKSFITKMTAITVATILSWILAVLFAYVANKFLVFKSKTNKKQTFKECLNFFKYRVLSLGIDLLWMWLFVQCFNMNDFVAKIFDQILIVIINYVFSKLFVFKNRN